MRGRLVWTVLVVVSGAPIAAAPAQAQQRFTGDQDIFSIELPGGWTPFDTNDAEAALAAPGGQENGTIFFGSADALGSLDDEAEEIAQGEQRVEERTLTIGGMPCVTFWTRDLVSQNNALICQFNVPLIDGTALTTFVLGSTSRPEQWAAHTRVFWDMAGTLKWRADIYR